MALKPPGFMGVLVGGQGCKNQKKKPVFLLFGDWRPSKKRPKKHRPIKGSITRRRRTLSPREAFKKAGPF
jgi:hypothetical protein